MHFDRLRQLLNCPMHVHSWYRSESHNMSVGGHPQSKHLTGIAIDFHIGYGKEWDSQLWTIGEVEKIAKNMGFHTIKYNWGLHIDCRNLL